MLNHLRVIEVATYIAAPSAGGLLADWGADVIKVEPPSGCPMRGAFLTPENYSPVFDVDNRGKRGITLDLANPDSAAIIKKLLENADVLLTNLRLKSLEKMGLGYEQLKAEFPRLIYAIVSGYGTVGPDRNLPGFDISAFFARSGLTMAHTPKTTDPVAPRTAVGDHTTGIATAAAILAAVLNRQKTERGCMIDSSLLRTGIYTLGSEFSIQLGFGRLASAKKRHEVRDPIANFFKTKDGRWLVLVPRPLDEREWRNLCKAVGAADMIENPDYGDFKKRRAACAEIVDRLDACFASRDLAEWRQILDDIDFVWAPLLKPAEVLEDAQTNAMEAFIKIPDRAGGRRDSVAGPVRFVDAETSTGSVPELGEDTKSVLTELGFDETRIAEMGKSGLFG